MEGFILGPSPLCAAYLSQYDWDLEIVFVGWELPLVGAHLVLSYHVIQTLSNWRV